MKWYVTASYARWCSDDPQVYETTVEADFEEEAEMNAELQCREDNGYAADDEPLGANLLTDAFARVVPDIDTCAATDAAELIDGDADAFPDGAGDAIRALVAHYSGV